MRKGDESRKRLWGWWWKKIRGKRAIVAYIYAAPQVKPRPSHKSQEANGE
ncbi:hypothetical protein RSAG8_02099, partial [Rhizoctonia solani AG-8 WAC10335]